MTQQEVFARLDFVILKHTKTLKFPHSMTKKLKKGKIVRREGFNLFDSEKFSRILSRRSYPPGVHGPKGSRRRRSTYGEQLRAKQQLKLMYGLRETQFSNLVEKAMRTNAKTGQEIIRLLERRLDNVVYRLGLAKSRSQARQMVTHRHISVNGKPTDIPSYLTKKGDLITIRDKSQAKKLFAATTPEQSDDKKKEAKVEKPSWLNWNEKEKIGKVTSEPETDAVESLVNISRVVEFYSR